MGFAEHEDSATVSVTDKQGKAVDVKVTKQANPMGTERIGRLIMKFSIPTVVMMVFNSLYNIVDTAFLQIAVPVTGAAVTQLAYPVQTILMGFSMLGGMGGNALAAIELGRGNKQKVEHILGNTASLLFGIAVLVAILSVIFNNQLLAALGTSEALWDPAKSFVTVICVGFVFQSLGMGLNNFLRTASKPNLALGTSIIGTIACIALNYLFVIRFGWGVSGSAYATVLGQFVGMVPVVAFFIFFKDAPFKLRLHNLLPDWKLIRDICALGLASFAIQAAQTLVTVVMNHVIALWATDTTMGFETALSVISIAWKVLALAYMPVIGVTAGVQPLLGFNVGAKLWGRVMALYKWSCIDCFVVATLFALVFWIAPELPLSLFSVREDLMDFACETVRIFAFWLPGVGYQIMAGSYFQSSGQPLKATILELTRQFLFLIPLYLILPHVVVSLFGMNGLDGVRIAPAASDILAFVTCTIFFIIEWRKLGKLRDQNEESAVAA